VDEYEKWLEEQSAYWIDQERHFKRLMMQEWPSALQSHYIAKGRVLMLDTVISAYREFVRNERPTEPQPPIENR